MADKTASVIQEMLTENTGTHFLDSGDAYGRHWQRNQGTAFENTPPVRLKFSGYNSKVQIEFTLNLYHFLKEHCSYEKELDKLFHGRFRKAMDKDDSKSWLELMEEFPGWLGTLKDRNRNLKYGVPGGIYGEGEPVTVNTYNDEEHLSQTIQFTYFSNSAGDFVILQVHGGCDVRGGYTKPRVFSTGHSSELGIFDYRRGTISCTGKDHLESALKLKKFQESQLVLPDTEVHKIDFDGSRDHYWTTDDTTHWYHQGACGRGAGAQLETYEVVNLDDEDNDQQHWEEGLLFIKEGVGYCPCCGAKLEGTF